MLLFVACQRPDQNKRVSFTLQMLGRPAGAGVDVAIFPVEDDRVNIRKDHVLGAGKTDEHGQITIEFKSPAKYSEYVPLFLYTDGATGMLGLRGGKPITFRCYTSPCDLGNVTIESFSVGGTGMSVR